MRCVAIALTVAALTSWARADQIVTFDFETEELGPLSSTGLVLTDATTGLTVTFLRPGAPLELVDLSPFGPAGFGSRTLSPFADTGPSPLRIVIDTSGLLPAFADYGVRAISWQQGDFLPSDVDDMFLFTLTSAGSLSGFLPVGPLTLEGAGFGMSAQSVERKNAITLFQTRSGSFEFPNSVFYDNFVFTLSATIPGTTAFSGGVDVPISGLGGGVLNSQRSSAGDAGAAPVPEPSSVALLAFGIAFLAAGLRWRGRSGAA